MQTKSIVRSLALAACLTPVVPHYAHAQIIKSVAGNPWYAYRVPGLAGATWVSAHDTLVGGQWAVMYSHQNDVDFKASGACSTAEAKPPLALSYIVPTTGLQEGSVIRLRTFSCGRFAGRINAVDSEAAVTSGSAARGNADEEAVWVLTGTGARPFVAWIAKSDMRVLRMSEK